jgi:peptidoglycan/LPS O-acetylase OafA/YrhL
VRPELPFLAAGGVAIAGGLAREKRWPADGGRAVLGTLALVIVASATAGTKIAPLIRAIGLLLLLASVMAAVPAFHTSRK